MRRKNDRGMPGRAEPSWNGNSRADSYGPQGNALILELQRLREAFDNEGQQDQRKGQTRRSSRDGGGRNRRPPSRKGRRRKKGKMERAIDICLRPFGLR